MNNQPINLKNMNPKLKYGLVLVIVPIMIAVTLLQGGTIGDVFTQKISDRETREIVQEAVNDNKSVYGFKVQDPRDVDCKERLPDKYDAKIQCSIDATRIIAGNIEGPITVTVRVRSSAYGENPIQVDIQNIQPNR